MKFSERWLREWVNPSITREQLMAQLTMAGLEIESVTPIVPIAHIVVAEVISAEKHPNADKLRVAMVDTGSERLQIVCGAANCRAGIKIPCALAGATMPNGLVIKKAELRGVESNGMLCSAKELGMAEESSGLLELPLDAPVGTSINDYLSLDDAILEINLTPNRGDCLGLRGIARETAVLNRMSLNEPVIEQVAATISDMPEVRLDAPDACPRFVARIVKGVNLQAATPLWMQEKLRRSGIRSLGLIVDITNYVMLELGQPMHAYDLRQISGAITVRWAKDQEPLKLLDGRDIAMSSDTLVIADQAKVLGLAAIMGGEHSGVADDTVDVLLEVAFFQPRAIAGRARRYGLHTDASHRFERGVDADLQGLAIERATGLILALGGGQAGPVVDASISDKLPKPASIHLRHARIERLLGISLTAHQVESILRPLGLHLTPVAGGWLCVAPSHRFDIAIEADLIEELIRIHGYDQLPARRPQSDLALVRVEESQVPLAKLRDTLVARGYQEIISFSFVEPKLMQKLEPRLTALPLMNPITPELAVMRTNLWAGLIHTARYNLNRQIGRMALFEAGLRFLTEGELKQEAVIAGLLHGRRESAQWNHGASDFDFYDLKGDVEALLALSPGRTVQFIAAEHPALHPGQCASVLIDGQNAGIIGALHPELVKDLDLPGDCYLFELQQEVLCKGRLPRYQALSAFPGVARDLAVVVEETVNVECLLGEIRHAAGALLEDLKVFDIYRGKGIDSGRKSVALGLTLRHPSRTLNDSDVASVVDAALLGMSTRYGAQLRQ